MRITSGFARGISLDSPRGDSTRPATDAARLALFSSLGSEIAEADVLDMFAGTGSYGLEALSRGARSATFVESSTRALSVLRRNAERVSRALANSKPKINILRADCLKCGAILRGGNFKIVFADPPYSMLACEDFLKDLLSVFCECAHSKSIIALEAPAQFQLPEFFETGSAKYAFDILKRLGKKSKGKPSQIIFTPKEA